MKTLVIDVGGTTVKAARVSAELDILESASVPTPVEPTRLTAAVVELAHALRSTDTVAVGVICPGVVADGVAVWAANVPWRDEPVRDLVQAAVGLPAFLMQDVAAAAI